MSDEFDKPIAEWNGTEFKFNDSINDDLRALRQFAQDVLECPTEFTYEAGQNCGLLDADGKPTRRLTGE